MVTMVIPLLVLSIISPPWIVEATPIVSTSYGLVRGYTTSSSHVFRGIPFAAPPVGKLRWQAPQLPKPWAKVKETVTSSPGCPQVNCDVTTPTIACPTKTSEDCLYLEVFTPLGAKNGSALPVMIFIHGGNFFTMSGSSPLFDGEVFTQRGNVLLVNINYRLGALGFMVTGRGGGAATGNYGLLDQRLAFGWVHENIRGFGGDPNKVTLFGQSAGSQSILHHMTSPKSAPYFRAAILESDPIALPYRNFEEAITLGGLLAEKLQCTIGDMVCLRSKSASAIAEASYQTRSMVSSLKLLEMFEPYGPYVDGTEVKGQPIEVIKSGGGQQPLLGKPVMLGTLTEETVLYIYSAFNASVSAEEYALTVALFKPAHSLQVLGKYPPNLSKADQREVLVNLSTDYVFACPTRYVARDLVLNQRTNTWVYVWNHAMSFPGWGHVTFCEGRVCHGTELVYVFDTASMGNFTMTPEETKLSYDVIDYWTNFAWTSDPNKGQNEAAGGNEESSLLWPSYNPSGNWSMLQFETPTRKVVRGYKGDYCDFWDNLGYS